MYHNALRLKLTKQREKKSSLNHSMQYKTGHQRAVDLRHVHPFCKTIRTLWNFKN